jgi:peptidoglycan hydrolase CwlO-like protein
VALDARIAEKQALMALSSDLLENLRPEIERLTADLVQRTLQSVWNKRARTFQHVEP